MLMLYCCGHGVDADFDIAEPGIMCPCSQPSGISINYINCVSFIPIIDMQDVRRYMMIRVTL